MKHRIDIKTWDRESVFNFFKKFLIAARTTTSEVDCTEAFKHCKENKISFFRVSLYAALRAINEIDELKYRIEDGGETVYMHDRIDALTPIKINDQHKFVEAYVPYNPDFVEFYSSVDQSINLAKNETDSYAFMNSKDPDIGVATVSCIPDLYFTSLTGTNIGDKNYNITIATIGKVVKREDRLVMPVAINAHHGLCDGHHLIQFFKKTEEYLKVVIK